MSIWPEDPNGDMVPILTASLEEAKMRHPSGKGGASGVLLTAAHRCDRCGAAAAYQVEKPNPELALTKMLLFCNHHWKKHFPVMVDIGWVVVGGNPDVIGDRP